MKRRNLALCVSVTLIAICLSFSGTFASKETGFVNVGDASICLDVVDRSCVDGNNIFPADVGKLCCFTRIWGVQGHADIKHIWYFGDTERARVELGVDSANWRTYSSKIIQLHEIGDWRVDVVGPDDELLKTVKFEIVQ
jgi:hypothetical protein